MKDIDYVGEHLAIGAVGNAFVVLSFVSALVATIAWFLATQKKDESWRQLARGAFNVHSLSVLGTVGVLFFMLFNKYYEYHYVWQHSNDEMPLRYIFSCFWEGQEGSFLLWTLWHVVLGQLLMRTAKSWESPVMAVFASVQVFLTSMILGVVLLDYKVGSNPFTVLLRMHPDFINLPLFTEPHYLQQLDGRGLNPLLQNYWMTIHPPTLFLGFASTLVPFAYSVAGLWTGRLKEWVKPALPWTFFSIMILGTGILMGGAWAYEALSFGGFWAWDPVENASLVPWLTLVAGGHVMLITRNKDKGAWISHFLVIISFILILYSTFLTRSGILGNASVHAFTDLGMSGQLLLYLLAYLGLGGALLAARSRQLFGESEEDPLWSREFWMLIGSLVLLISAAHIITITSMPVINKIFDTKWAPSAEASTYHKVQVPLAIVISVLVACTQFLKYRKTNMTQAGVKLGIWTLIGAGFASLFAFALDFSNVFYVVLLFTAAFSVAANFGYLIQVLKGKILKAGASIAHIGFGLILLGALVSTSNQTIMSRNTSGIDVSQLGESFSNQENILLFKDSTVRMGDYIVAYRGKEKDGYNLRFQVDYMQFDKDGLTPAFTLNPTVQLNPRMGNVSEPDTRHFLGRDIYTHVTFAELEEPNDLQPDGYRKPKEYTVGIGDSLFSSNAIIVFDSLIRNMDAEGNIDPNNIVLGAALRAVDMQGNEYPTTPVWGLDSGRVYNIPVEMTELGLKLAFVQVKPVDGSFIFTVAEKPENKREFIVMKAIQFPYINILWLGCILMAIGTSIAVWNRIKLNNRKGKDTTSQQSAAQPTTDAQS